MSLPVPAILLIAATLLPLLSFGLLVFVGKRLGKPAAGVVATLAIGLSFGCSLAAMMVWLDGTQAWGAGRAPIYIPLRWIPVGAGLGQDHPGFLDLAVYVDSLTVAMFNMVTLISTLIFIFSLGYMRHDSRFPRFFTYLSLFCFSMLGLVLGGTILQLFIFWELVGLCSYLLIGFWYEKKSASDAAVKAFVVNRIGDFGFLIGFGILFYHVGNASLPGLWALLGGAGGGGPVTLANGTVFSAGLLTLMGVGLFCGAIGKSAQFPLHVWLPDAMEGPTPVSALIHAATMVAAGVYLVGRIFPILTPDAKLFIAIIGCTTLTMAALIALVQSDIKRVLAYSTLSQLGYMILAMGVGSWIGGLFHLITHAFFKALLFLGSGSVIDAAHHEQELPQYGGLWRKIPVTAVTFGIGVLAIAGTPFLSGYYSKDLILAHAGAFGFLSEHHGRSAWNWLLFYLPVGVAYLTAFYMGRCWMLTFWGKPRNEHVYHGAGEKPVMYIPLIVLAVLSVVAGNMLGVRQLLQGAMRESSALITHLRGANAPAQDIFVTAWPSESAEAEAAAEGEPAAQALTLSQTAHVHGEHAMHTAVGWAFAIGLGLAALMYWNGYSIARRLAVIPPLGAIHTWLYRRMYFDELYRAVFLAILIGASRLAAAIDRVVVDALVNLTGAAVKAASWLAGLHDRVVVDGAVDGAARLVQDIGAAARAPQTGRIRGYVTALVALFALGLGAAMVWVLL